jgi:hypothetical protein
VHLGTKKLIYALRIQHSWRYDHHSRRELDDVAAPVWKPQRLERRLG